MMKAIFLAVLLFRKLNGVDGLRYQASFLAFIRLAGLYCRGRCITVAVERRIGNIQTVALIIFHGHIQVFIVINRSAFRFGAAVNAVVHAVYGFGCHGGKYVVDPQG